MKKISTAIYIFMATFILTGFISIAINEMKPKTVANPAVSVPIKQYKYIVKLEGESVAVFKQNGELDHYLDVTYNGLTEYDQKLIKIGIKVDDDEALRQLEEDLTS